ncbi:MAG: hypothetical protein IJF90_06955 [Synergistaceae bacterium]|nr:hypothetical protein [Synergistaceae bacterium]MBQ6417243.1 hypothetical protein [Synergistaceae bacterium]
MTTATMERNVKTGNIVLDMRLPLLTGQELEKLADYANYLMWSREDDDDDDWADAPLTEDEISQIEESERDFANGEYLTVDELLAGLQECGQ